MACPATDDINQWHTRNGKIARREATGTKDRSDITRRAAGRDIWITWGLGDTAVWGDFLLVLKHFPARSPSRGILAAVVDNCRLADFQALACATLILTTVQKSNAHLFCFAILGE